MLWDKAATPSVEYLSRGEVKIIAPEGSMVVSRGWGRGNEELLFSGYRVLKTDGGNGSMTLRMYLMIPLICILKND